MLAMLLLAVEAGKEDGNDVCPNVATPGDARLANAEVEGEVAASVFPALALLAAVLEDEAALDVDAAA